MEKEGRITNYVGRSFLYNLSFFPSLYDANACVMIKLPSDAEEDHWHCLHWPAWD